MNFENERRYKGKALVIFEMIILTLVALLFIYVACYQVHASTVSDNDALVYALSKTAFEEKEGYFIVEISETECAYVPEGYTYWIVTDEWTVVSNNELYVHTNEDGTFQLVANGSSGFYGYNRSGTLASQYLFFTGTECGHGHFKGTNWRGTSPFRYAYGANVLMCETGEAATPTPEVSASPLPSMSPLPSEMPFPTVTPFPIVTAQPMATEVPFFEATPEDLSTTNILLLLIFIIELADFILKRIGGIYRCTK